MAEIFFALYGERSLRKQRTFRDRGDPLAFSDGELIARYRLPKSELIMLLGLVEDDLRRSTNRNQALLPIHVLCVGLRQVTKLRLKLN